MDVTSSPREAQLYEEPIGDDAESHDQLIKSDLAKPATMAFRGIMRDAAYVGLLSAAYKKPVRVNETPELDATFPTSAQQDREYAEQTFAALADTSDFSEKQRAIEKKS